MLKIVNLVRDKHMVHGGRLPTVNCIIWKFYITFKILNDIDNIVCVLNMKLQRKCSFSCE